MTLKNLSILFGIVFLAIGVLGFIPGITNEKDQLLGIFQISVVHNIVHILSGVAALLAAKSEDYAQLYFRVFGAVYALVAIIGLVQGDQVLFLLDPINMADNILHIVLAVAILGIGFGVPKSSGPKTV